MLKHEREKIRMRCECTRWPLDALTGRVLARLAPALTASSGSYGSASSRQYMGFVRNVITLALKAVLSLATAGPVFKRLLAEQFSLQVLVPGDHRVKLISWD